MYISVHNTMGKQISGQLFEHANNSKYKMCELEKGVQHKDSRVDKVIYGQ